MFDKLGQSVILLLLRPFQKCFDIGPEISIMVYADLEKEIEVPLSRQEWDRLTSLETAQVASEYLV